MLVLTKVSFQWWVWLHTKFPAIHLPGSHNPQLSVIAIKTSSCSSIPGELRIQWEAQDASEITSTHMFFCWHRGRSYQYRPSSYSKLSPGPSHQPSFTLMCLIHCCWQARPSDLVMDDFVRLHNHLPKVWLPMHSKCIWNHFIGSLADLLH